MRSIQRSGFMALVLAGACLQGATPEPSGFQVSAALPLELANLRNYTNNSVLGLSVEGQYQIPLPEGTTLLRGGAGLNLFPGSSKDGVKISLYDLQFMGDLVFPFLEGRCAFITGLSLNTWMKKASGTRDGVEYSASGVVKKPFTKLGYRVGFEARVNRNWAVSALLQMTELGLDSEFIKDGLPDYGERNVLPSWIQFGAKYSF